MGYGPPTLGGVLDGFSNGEGENPLFLPYSLEMGGGVGGVSRARFPPRWGPGPRVPRPGGPGPKPWAPSPCEPQPQAP